MPAVDLFKNDSPNSISPAVDLFTVTPDDTNDMPNVARGFWVGTGGNLVIVTTNGVTVTLKNVSGFVGGFRIARVKATGTTAADIVGYV